jgi:glycosyltransferase involved in cell wall biosynthesis
MPRASADQLSSLSVFVPCLNEEKNIPGLMRSLEKVLPTLAKQFEIIFIDDGSTDHTGPLIDQLAQQDAHVRAIHHPHNRGYGASLRSGFAAANCDWVFFTDGDQQFSIEQLREFVPYTKQSPVIIGYRRHRAEGKRRTLNAWLYKQFINLLFQLGVRDIDCAFKLLRTKSIQNIPLQSSGAFLSAELLIRLKRSGEQFVQLPVDHRKRRHGQPTGSQLKVIVKALIEALNFWRKNYIKI